MKIRETEKVLRKCCRCEKCVCSEDLCVRHKLACTSLSLLSPLSSLLSSLFSLLSLFSLHSLHSLLSYSYSHSCSKSLTLALNLSLLLSLSLSLSSLSLLSLFALLSLLSPLSPLSPLSLLSYSYTLSHTLSHTLSLLLSLSLSYSLTVRARQQCCGRRHSVSSHCVGHFVFSRQYRCRRPVLSKHSQKVLAIEVWSSRPHTQDRHHPPSSTVKSSLIERLNHLQPTRQGLVLSRDQSTDLLSFQEVRGRLIERQSPALCCLTLGRDWSSRETNQPALHHLCRRTGHPSSISDEKSYRETRHLLLELT